MAICDRNCNVLCPFVPAPGNRNECKLLCDALKSLKETAKAIGLDISNSIMSFDGVYDSCYNRKAIFNAGMKPNIPENKRNRKKPKRGRKRHFDEEIFEERFETIERIFAWEDKFRRLMIRWEHKSQNHYGFKLLAYAMINLRHFV